MARIFATPEAELGAKAWLHDVTLAAGVRTNNQRTNARLNFPQWFIDASVKVCDELKNRAFTDVDDSIRALADTTFYPRLSGSCKRKKYNAEGVAKTIVYMAELLQLYWDDTVRTTYEIEEFKKTILGATVYKYGRYISAIGSNSNSTSTQRAARAAGQPPKNNYKQSGPQSGNVRDLQDPNGHPGTPGMKFGMKTNIAYRIIGDTTTSKNVPNVFIKPLSASGAAGNTNKIHFSSGNGYTDCTCYFEDPNDAQDFLDKIIAAGRVPADVTNPRVVQRPAESNGYFLVGTEFGLCAISAQKLNEALSDNKENTNEGFAWDKVMENMSEEELADLTKWARL